MKRAKVRTELPLIDLILRRQVKIGVLGLGYVGLPLAMAFARHGFTVTGFDIDTERIAHLQAGHAPDSGIATEHLAPLLA